MAKILLVEDDKSLREIYGVRLQAEGYTIVSAGDGEEALAMAIKERPDLIVSDVMMPKISGFDMLDILRSTTETKDVKVIMMTALSSDDQRARGESLGADRYLVKSQVGIEDVVRTVHDVLGDGVAVPTPAPAPSFPLSNAQPTDPATIGLPPAPQAVDAVALPDPTPAAPAPVAPITAPVVPEPVAAPISTPDPAPAAPAPFTPPTAPLPPATEAQPALDPVYGVANSEPVAEAQPQPATQAFAQPPVEPAPVAPQPEPTPAVTPEPATFAPAPAAPVFPPVPEPVAETPAPVEMPQPTAPFSTPAPASLGERVIQPLTNPIDAQKSEFDISTQLSQALDDQAPAPAPTPTPPVPPAQ